MIGRWCVSWVASSTVGEMQIAWTFGLRTSASRCRSDCPIQTHLLEVTEE